MPKFSDTQLVILNAAAERDDRALRPVPTSIKAKGNALTASLKSLLDRGLAEEVDGVPPEQAWRTDEDGRGVGLAITPAGLQAIGLGTDGGEEPARPAGRDRKPDTAEPAAPRAKTKGAKLVTLLSSQKGATIDALVKKLGWQAHTVRAAMTGLRKRGYAVERDKRADGTTVYRITSKASQ
jgi:hypothetical protein